MDSFGPFHHPNNTQNSPELAQPTLQRKHGNFQTDFAVSHGSRRLYLLKLISISLVWIHAGHVMLCSWTHLDPFKIPNTYQKQPTAVGPAHINHTESMAIFSQFLASSMDTMKCICWNSSVSFCCGSVMAIQCVAGHVWSFLSSQTPQHQPVWSGSAHSESMAILRQLLDFPMDPMDCNCWNSSVTFFCGSIIAIQCVAGHVWSLLLSPSP